MKIKRSKISIIILLLLVLVSSAWADDKEEGDNPKRRRAPRMRIGEIGALVNFSRADYGNGTYSKTRRFTGSFAYYLTQSMQIELSYSDGRTFYNSNGSPRSTTDTWDRNLSLAINQALLSGDSVIQPYVKAGAAQLNRIQSITIEGVQQADSVLKQPSGVLGTGIRIFLSSSLSLRAELTTFLPDFHISAAKENYDWEAGLSFHF